MNRLAFALSVLCLTHFTGWSQSANLTTNSTFFSFECEGLLPELSLDNVLVCPGELIPSLELPAMDGVTWTWENDNTTTGLGSGAEGDIPAWEALPNTSDTANTGTVTVIGQVPGCDAVEVGFYETGVLPTPTITALPADTIICSGQSADVVLSINTNDTLFWTSTWDPAIEGEVGAFGSELLLDYQFFNTSLNPADVVFTVTVVSALNSNICPFNDEVVTVTVLPEGCEVECASDINNNGVCDDQEVPGCTYAFAQNYNPEATDDDGSCTVAECASTEQDECVIEGDFNGDGVVGTGDLLAFLTMFGSECELECQAGDPCFAYSLTVEASPAANPQLGTTYRFYVNLENETDFVSAVFGNNLSALSVFAPNGVYNDPANTSWSAAGINPAFLTTFPDLAADTYATIGLEGPASLSGIADAIDPSIVSDMIQPITPFFTDNGAMTLLSNTENGAAWFLLPAGNGSPQSEPWRVLLMQVTTTGSISGQINYQIFLDSDMTNAISFVAAFDGAGVFPSEELIFIEGCMDENACNYDPDANVEPLDACVNPDVNGNCN